MDDFIKTKLYYMKTPSKIKKKPIFKNESDMLQHVFKKIKRKKPTGFPDVLVPNGDDALVMRSARNHPWVVTTDTLVEGTHFNFAWMQRFWTPKQQWRYLGYKAIACNLSDCAAMGSVVPRFILLTFGFSGDISVDNVDNLLDGAQLLQKKCGYLISGGDAIHSEKTILSVTVLGELTDFPALYRKGAQMKEQIWISGPLGLSAAGLEILKNGPLHSKKHQNTLLKAHMTPIPQMEWGHFLGKNKLASAALDTSDDLETSLNILAKNSQVGLQVDLEKCRVHPALAAFCKERRKNPYDFILRGGEDYQLLFTASAKHRARIQRKFPQATVIGTVLKRSEGIQIHLQGKPFSANLKSYQHFGGTRKGKI